MKHETAIKAFAGIALLASMFAIVTATLTRNESQKALGGSVSGFNSFASSSAITVGTGSTMVSATNTARVYLELSNTGAAAVYCNLRNGAAATLFSGFTIFGSSTKSFKVDENPYIGPVHCIGHANTVVTVLER